MESLSEDKVMEEEWIQLIMEARDLGLSPREIRDFLQKGREERILSLVKEGGP